MRDRGSTNPFDRALEALYLKGAAAEDLRSNPKLGDQVARTARLTPQQVRPHDPREDVDMQRPGIRGAGRGVVSVLDAAIKRAMLLDDAPMANAQLVDPDRHCLTLTAYSGFSDDFLEFFATVGDTSCACGSAFATGQPTWIDDITSSNVFDGTRALEVMLDAGSRSVASIPIRARGGGLIGMLSVHHARPTRWTHARKAELRRLAGSSGRLLDHVMRI
jgi:putative methionine-R-sulfoxide reductase with GAF domain